jgi:hypothetical protein
MSIEMIGFGGFVFAFTTIAAILYERRMDVLHGRYVEQFAEQDRKKMPILAPVIADHFRWRARNMIYLTSIIAC